MSVKIPLKYPINDAGVDIDALTLRRPKVRDMLNSADKDKSDAENEVRLFAHLCDVPPDLIEQLDVIDYQQVQQAYTGFLS